MDYFNKSIVDTVFDLKTSVEEGLSDNDVDSRLKKYGGNVLVGAKEKSVFHVFLEHFKDFLVIILIIACAISFVLNEVLDGSIILIVVFINALLGTFQENKANNALKALKEMSSPKAKVIRNGALIKVSSSALVPGDMVVLETGDCIPADLRLIDSVNLKIDESALTGESVPVEKSCDEIVAAGAGVADRVNCAYMSTVVTYGRGYGVVTETGMNTQIGKIASMLNTTPVNITPLQKKLDSFGKTLGFACIVICFVIFLLGVYRGNDLLEIFMTAVSLAVAAIPEGLTVVVTVVLALGMQQMVKKHAIIKRLSAVETLGSTTVICSDKTGTLTQNKMTVVKLFDGDAVWNVSGSGYSADGEIVSESGTSFLGDSVTKLIEGAVLCNDAQFNSLDEKIIGDPTEAALLVLGAKAKIEKTTLNEKFVRMGEIPFDSDRKLMSTVHAIGNSYVMYTKGAPDEILLRCSSIYRNGIAVNIQESDKQKITDINSLFANSALRVLAVSFKKARNTLAEENDLIFVGLIGMIDPPRHEAKLSVEICKKAGIRPIMITGDHKITAGAIAKELGITDDETLAISGVELDNLTDDQLKDAVRNISVFARVAPEHKVKLVEAVKSHGEIVAMTGDGVNDAPALKRADIGIAMGITGTDVSKEAADMILTDDNFSSIVDAVHEGRVIYGNIRKVVSYLLSCNIGEILIIFVAMLIGFEIPLAPIHLLFVNLITDAFPAFALGMEQKEDGMMDVPPRNPDEPIVDRSMRISIVFQSVALCAAVLLSFAYAFNRFDGTPIQIIAARTSCFVTLIFGELLRAFSARSENKSIFKLNLFSNSALNKSVLLSTVLLLLIVYVPVAQSIFKTTPIGIYDLLVALLFAFIPLIGGELGKLSIVKK